MDLGAKSLLGVPPAPSARSFLGYHVNPQLEKKVFAMDSHIFNKYPQTKSIFGVRGVVLFEFYGVFALTGSGLVFGRLLG